MRVVDDDVARRRPPSVDARMQNVDGGHELHDVGMSPKQGAGRRDTYKSVAFPSSHALFTGRARKSSSAMAARQRKYGMLLTGALVLFVYVASYGLGRREDQRRDMHSDGTFSAPVGYSTKGIDFRHAFLQREADNKAIMHQIHKQAAAASEAAGGAAGVLGPAGEPSTSSSPVAHPTMHPRSSVGRFASAKSAGGIPLPPLIVASKEGGQPHGLSGHAPDTGGLPQGQGRGGMMHGLGSWLRAGELSPSSASDTSGPPMLSVGSRGAGRETWRGGAHADTPTFAAEVKKTAGGGEGPTKAGPTAAVGRVEARSGPHGQGRLNVQPQVKAGSSGADSAAQVARKIERLESKLKLQQKLERKLKAQQARPERDAQRIKADVVSHPAGAHAQGDTGTDAGGNANHSSLSVAASMPAAKAVARAQVPVDSPVRKGGDWVAARIRAEMHTAGTKDVGEGAAAAAVEAQHSPGKSGKDSVAVDAGLTGDEMGRAAARKAASDPAATRQRAAEGLKQAAWTRLPAPTLHNIRIDGASVADLNQEALHDTRVLPSLAPLDHEGAVDVAPAPPAAAAPAVGDEASQDASHMERIAQAAVGGSLFKSDLFKVLKPFPEPPAEFSPP